jgi:hypothetical protein
MQAGFVLPFAGPAASKLRGGHEHEDISSRFIKYSEIKHKL